MTNALVTNRDGIAGDWLGALFEGNQFALETPGHLIRWEPWVRAAILDFDLLSHMHFSWHNESNQESFSLWHTEMDNTVTPPTAACGRIVTLIRPDEAVFESQLALVEGYADLREDRAGEVVAQLGPCIAFWSSIVNLHPDHKRWTLELVDVALRFANLVEMRFKHALACRRPVELSPQIQPMILTPGHGAFPSGHATEAFMLAYLLWELVPDITNAWCEQLMRQAARIAINRTVAGVHFPVDSAAGQLLGLTLAEYFMHRCRPADDDEAVFYPWRFDGTRFQPAAGPAADFNWRQLYDAPNGTRLIAPFTDWIDLEPMNTQSSALLRWLWDMAAQEWT